jgi:hypothetical protein
MAKMSAALGLTILICCSANAQQQPAPFARYSVRNATIVTSWRTATGQQPFEYRIRNGYGQSSARTFWLMTALTSGLTVADIELSQACLQRHTCAEANPLLPSSRAAAYGIQLPLSTGVAFLSNRSRLHGSRRWWVPEAGISAGHAVGVASGLHAMF